MQAAQTRIEALLEGNYEISKRFLAVLLLEEDAQMLELVRQKEPAALAEIEFITQNLKSHSKDPIEYKLAIYHKEQASRIADKVMHFKGTRKGLRSWIDSFLMHPVAGSLFLYFVLYWGIYQFVGVFGAGTVVDFFEDTVFGQWVHPVVRSEE